MTRVLPVLFLILFINTMLAQETCSSAIFIRNTMNHGINLGQKETC